MWSLLLFSTWRLALQEPKPLEPAVEGLRSKVLSLEKELAEAREALAQRDALLKALRSKQTEPEKEPREEPKAVSKALRGAKDCDFQEGMDYMGGTEQLATAKSSRKECCQLCVQHNREAEGSCTVAVLSSASDTPPNACWIKAMGQKAVLKPFHKAGVVVSGSMQV